MTNDELLARAEKAEAELAATKRTLELLLLERSESQLLMASVVPLVPEINERAKSINVREYKEALQGILQRLDEMPLEPSSAVPLKS